MWTLLLVHTGCGRPEVLFLERNEGDSVVFRCELGSTDPPPYGLELSRKWLRTHQVLFKFTKDEPTFGRDEDKARISVVGDPSSLSVNVTLSQLRASDTDRYTCEFIVDNPVSKDLRLQGAEVFVLVNSGVVETCAGGSVVLPCLPPRGEALAVEGVSLKRQRDRWAPVELLYHSKHHRSSTPSSSSSLLPDERVQLALASSPAGIAYNLTLLQLQPEDSGLYGCTLLLRGSPDRSSHLGRKVFYVSVQGQCGCSGYSSLLYALSAAVAVLLLLLLFMGCVLLCRGKARKGVKSHPQAPIYEDMAGVKTESRKLAPHLLDDMDSSEYKNCHVKKSCPENYYERPSGSLHPRKGSP